MRYCMKFSLKGHQKYQISKLEVPKITFSIQQIYKAKILTSGISDANWDITYRVPYFKAPYIGKDIFGVQEHGSTFI